MKTAKNLFLVAGLCLGLGACGSADSLKFWRADKPEPCPRITVLKNASEVTKFKEGAGRDLIDVLFEAHVSNVLSACKYDVDYDTRAGLISAQVAPVIRGKRGPADRNRYADIPYFVAVVDENKKILQKQNFSLRLAFPGNLTQNEVRDEPIDLSFVTDGTKDGSDFEIYVGLQLSREEMAYNQKINSR